MRHLLLKALSTLTLLAVLPTHSASIIVGTLGLEQLPPNEFRRVIGTWLLKETGCTRSIEAVQGNYFMVARCRDVRSDDKGLPLSKQDDMHYLGKATGWAYEIAEDGKLNIRTRAGATMVAEPHDKLWPEK